VLVVETVPQYLERLTEQLKNLGYRVVIARSGTEAIEKARSLQPCAVFLNPLLPQLSGWDVLTILKSDAQTLHIPVLVTATQAEKQQAYHNKADGFLSLPIQEQALRQNLTDLGDRNHSSSSSLTILHLNPELIDRRTDSSVLSSELAEALSLQHSEINYRVLEADDLDQAELLARVWHPDVIVLDNAGIADPLAYLKQYSLQASLTSLPLVTLNHQTTEAANQVSGLSVYPCLAPDNSLKIAALLQVIQIAAGIRHKPNILVMDIGEQGCWAAGEISQSKIPSPNPSNCPILSARQGRKSKLATPPQQSSWLQALTQYLQTAGFGSCLSCSWGQVHRQLQEQNVDLVLIRLKNISDYPAVVKGLISLAQLQKRPPVLVLDHRLDTQLGDEAVADVLDSTSDLESVLRTVATRILRGSSHSMTQLLDQINQILS
jgi:CheY-like chemotaxis protein